MEFKGVKQERLKDTTRFWVVKPRIGVGGVSGLETIVSGAYIEVDPGEGGQPSTKFTGLEQPEIYQLGNPGTSYILLASKLGALSRGSPIKFRGIEVGSVTRYKLVEDHSHVEIEIFVRAPHDKYIKANTRFWNISGLEVELGAEGVKLNLESMVSLMAGGVSFSTKDDSVFKDQAAEKTAFRLYESEQQEIEESLAFGAPMKLYFDEGVSGLSVGAPVEFKGLRVGTVTAIAVEASVDENDILTYAIIEIEPDRLPRAGKEPVLTAERRLKEVYDFIEKMVDKGMRAQLKSGNLVTGQALVALDFFPAAEKRTIKYVAGMPVLPTVPETLAGILNRVDKVMTRLGALPLEEIGTNIEQATAGINSLLRSYNAAEGGVMGLQISEAINEFNSLLRSYNAAEGGVMGLQISEAINDFDSLLRSYNAAEGGVMGLQISEALDDIDSLLRSFDAAEGGVMGLQIREALDELAKAARSIRSMSRYLERHPEALLKGKDRE